MTRLIQPLTLLEWTTAGADVWRTPPPKVSNAGYDADQNLQVTLDTSSPASMGGLPAIPQAEDEGLHVYGEKTTGERQTAGTVRATVPWTDALGVFPRLTRGRAYEDQVSTPPWRSDEPATYYAQGLLGAVVLEAVGAAAGFNWTLWVPFNWWSVDAGRLLWILARFYGAGNGLGYLYLDREAILDYSGGVRSYLRRRRVFTWRVAGESLIDHVKRVALDTGAMMSWGGFQADSDTVQAFGLGVTDWDSLRELSGVYDASPSGDAGRDMFLASPVTLRSAEEYLLNKGTTRWAGGWLRTFKYQSELGANRYTTRVQFPFEPLAQLDPPAGPVAPDTGRPNLLEDIDEASISQRGERPVVRDLPAVIDRESADALTPARWTEDRRIVEWRMGPIHWDFDVGNIIHLRFVELGLDGTEDLLVTRKRIDWNTLHAAVETLEVSRDPTPMEPTAAEINASCYFWGNATVGMSAAFWVDLSGKGNHATVKAGDTGPVLTSAANGLAGWPVLDFDPGSGGSRRLQVASGGVVRDWDNLVDFGITIVAVVQLDNPSAPGYILSGAQAAFWGLGVTDLGGFCFTHKNTPPTIVATAISGRWHIVTCVIDLSHTEGSPLNLLDGTEVYSDHLSPAELEGTGSTALDFQELYIGGKTGSTATQAWRGRIAELQLYASPLRPHYIRRLHAAIRARYPGEGL